MIGKVLRGTNAARLLYYLYGPGKANEHTNPHLVAGFSDPEQLEPEHRPDGSRDFRRLAGLLAQPLAALYGPSYDKPVWHCSVRAAPGDRILSDAEWAEVAAEIMHRTGLAPRGDEAGVRWVAVRHAGDHIHLVATLARQDGGRPRIWNDFYRVREACRAAEERFGLVTTAPGDRTAARRPSRSETEQAARRGWAEAPRIALRREVCTAAAGARTERDFFAALEDAGVLVRRRYSTVNPGQVTGYAVGLPHHRNRDGATVWYGGGKLAVTLPGHRDRQGRPLWYSGGRLSAELTLPRLRGRWGTHRPATAERSGAGAARSGTFRFTAQERDAIYEHAAHQAAAAAEHIRSCAHRDPAAAADAAWAVADTLHVAARAAGNQTLRRAATPTTGPPVRPTAESHAAPTRGSGSVPLLA